MKKSLHLDKVASLLKTCIFSHLFSGLARIVQISPSEVPGASPSAIKVFIAAGGLMNFLKLLMPSVELLIFVS